MSELTMIIASVEGLFKNLEGRIDRLEKLIGRDFHGHSGYTKGCRCDICHDAKMQYVKEYRARLREKKKSR